MDLGLLLQHHGVRGGAQHRQRHLPEFVVRPCLGLPDALHERDRARLEHLGHVHLGGEHYLDRVGAQLAHGCCLLLPVGVGGAARVPRHLPRLPADCKFLSRSQ